MGPVILVRQIEELSLVIRGLKARSTIGKQDARV